MLKISTLFVHNEDQTLNQEDLATVEMESYLLSSANESSFMTASKVRHSTQQFMVDSSNSSSNMEGD